MGRAAFSARIGDSKGPVASFLLSAHPIPRIVRDTDRLQSPLFAIGLHDVDSSTRAARHGGRPPRARRANRARGVARRRQRARSDDRGRGHHPGGLSAHELDRRRLLLARARSGSGSKRNRCLRRGCPRRHAGMVCRARGYRRNPPSRRHCGQHRRRRDFRMGRGVQALAEMGRAPAAEAPARGCDRICRRRHRRYAKPVSTRRQRSSRELSLQPGFERDLPDAGRERAAGDG